MNKSPTTITVATGQKQLKTIGGYLFIALSIGAFVTGHWGFGIIGIILGMGCFGNAMLSGSAKCPNCEFQLTGIDPKALMRCTSCRQYLQGKGEVLAVVDENTVCDNPFFAIALPWDDLDRCTEAAITLAPKISTTGGTRTVSASWPPECCVCGKPFTKQETVSLVVVKHGTLMDEKVPLYAAGVPHCAGHANGVILRLDSYQGEQNSTGKRGAVLLFRSYKYFQKFTALNQWAGKGPAGNGFRFKPN